MAHADLQSHYDSECYWRDGYGYRDYLGDRMAARHNFEDVLEWIGRKPPGSLLEVGCGPGLFLQMAQEAGWNVHGIDRSRWAVAEAVRLLGADIVDHGALEEVKLPFDTYDVIVLHDVLEHLTNPRQVFEHLHRLLAPLGLFFVDYWNKDSLMSGLMGNRWHAIDPPDHIIHYNHASIRKLIRTTGFRVAAERMRGRFLTLNTILDKMLPHSLTRNALGSCGNRGIPINLRDHIQLILSRADS
jgi:2-polyprenyl-3-methyl-5-hydroxy-6-metoxy-1,4-benzoquinol methylase